MRRARELRWLQIRYSLESIRWAVVQTAGRTKRTACREGELEHRERRLERERRLGREPEQVERGQSRRFPQLGHFFRPYRAEVFVRRPLRQPPI